MGLSLAESGIDERLKVPERKERINHFVRYLAEVLQIEPPTIKDECFFLDQKGLPVGLKLSFENPTDISRLFVYANDHSTSLKLHGTAFSDFSELIEVLELENCYISEKLVQKFCVSPTSAFPQGQIESPVSIIRKNTLATVIDLLTRAGYQNSTSNGLRPHQDGWGETIFYSRQNHKRAGEPTFIYKGLKGSAIEWESSVPKVCLISNSGNLLHASKLGLGGLVVIPVKLP